MDEPLVKSVDEVRQSLHAFNAEAGQEDHRARARNLLVTTTYWVHDTDTDTFGPAKFVGLAGVSLSSYSEARLGVSGFDTRVALEEVLGRPFTAKPLQTSLRAWGESLIGPGAFGGAEEDKWRFASLTEVGESPQLPLALHSRYGRQEAFAAVEESYTPQDQHKNTGLSPRCPDGGYLIFITLNKDNFDPAYDYLDELGADWFRWTTRRDRGEDHPDYERLREPGTRTSLFVRGREREDFAYLGELNYKRHRQFRDDRQGRVQQEYLFGLQEPISDELLRELGGVSEGEPPKPGAAKKAPSPAGRSRRPASLNDFKVAFSYALGRLERVLVPAHHNYQVRLKTFFEARGIRSTWERNFVDVEFTIGDELHIGEIKVTTTLRLEEAFRTAVGQVLEYAYLGYEKAPRMTIFFDQVLDDRRVALASRLGIAVVSEDGGAYRCQNPEVNPRLAASLAVAKAL